MGIGDIFFKCFIDVTIELDKVMSMYYTQDKEVDNITVTKVIIGKILWG